MFHRVTVIGHLGRNPELRYTQDGTPVASFSVAATKKWTGRDGNQGEKTVWFRISAWRKLGEVCNQYLQKGRLVMVEGELNADDNGNPKTFERNDGTTGASYEIIAHTVKFLGRSGGNDSGDAPADEPPAAMTEEEIPF